MPPEEFAKLVAFVKEHRQSDAPFDVIHGGHSPADPVKAAAVVRPYAEAGVTWWLESIDPWTYGGDAPAETWDVETMRARIKAGPPRT